MTLREKIANVILGGGLVVMYEQMKDAMRKANIERRRTDEARLELDMSRIALRQIAEQETPGANATVRRMARMAREGLGK